MEEHFKKLGLECHHDLTEQIAPKTRFSMPLFL